mgnify:CR=1 FL=1
MLNEEKIKIMNRLAMYEQGEGKKYLPVSRYYRSDYIGLAMIKNFFLVTISYCLVLAVLTYIQYTIKYRKAKKSVKNYYEELTQLNKIYSREEKKSSARGVSGGYKK